MERQEDRRVPREEVVDGSESLDLGFDVGVAFDCCCSSSDERVGGSVGFGGGGGGEGEGCGSSTGFDDVVGDGEEDAVG